MSLRRTARLVADYLVIGPLRLLAARCSRLITWVREVPDRPGDPRRSVGGVPEPVRTEENAPSRDEIRAAYWAGQSLGELTDRWGLDPKTITIWIYRD